MPPALPALLRSLQALFRHPFPYPTSGTATCAQNKQHFKSQMSANRLHCYLKQYIHYTEKVRRSVHKVVLSCLLSSALIKASKAILLRYELRDSQCTFWDASLYSLVDSHQCLVRTCCSTYNSTDKSKTFLLNVATYMPNSTALQL